MTVYFMDDKHQFVKIGRSKSPDQRVGNVQTGNPRELELITLDSVAEKEVHQLFSSLRERGEWFRRKGNLKAFLEGDKFIYRSETGILKIGKIEKKQPRESGFRAIGKRIINKFRRKQ